MKTNLSTLRLVTLIVRWGLAIASGVYTFVGISPLLEPGASRNFVAALLFAIVITGGIGAFWMWQVTVLPETRDPRRVRLMLIGLVAGMLTIAGISSWPNASALGGAAALDHHLRQHVGAGEDLGNQAYLASRAARSLLYDLRSDAARYANLAERERSQGYFTGYPGAGPVWHVYSQVSARLGNLADTLEESLTDMDGLREEAASIVGEMRAVVDAPGQGQRVRRLTFEAHAAELDAVLIQLVTASPAGTIERTAENLLAELVIPPIAERSALSADQRAAIGGMRDAVQTTARKLVEAAREVAVPEMARPRYVPMHAFQAIAHYAGDFVPTWMGALMIDQLPAVLLIFMVVAERNGRDRGTPPARPPGSKPYDEVMDDWRTVQNDIRNSDKVRTFPNDRERKKIS